MSIVRLTPTSPVGEWCERHGVQEAMSGGFFTKPDNVPIGEFRATLGSNGYRPFRAPWDRSRGALHLSASTRAIDRRDRLTVGDEDELLQAGPTLVLNGQNAVQAQEDPEGFSQTADEFDQDLTLGRLPRLGIALTRDHWLAVAVDGRSDEDAGLSLPEFADLFVALGAYSALNLDGGSSAALVAGGTMRNAPRDDEGALLPAGGPTTSAIVFRPAAA